MWRWDQGRLIYFQYDNLVNISKVLVNYNNVRIKDCEDRFRNDLVLSTGLPFLPTNYTVLRNYKRVFECAFLATVKNNNLLVTDFCRELAKDNGYLCNVDDYLFAYIKRFRFPFSAFDNYNQTDLRTYPFCAIIKFLLALFISGKEAKLTIEDVFYFIEANGCTGIEDIEYYKQLTAQPYTITESEKRQVREMLVFISQLSILKMHKGVLFLDVINSGAINELIEKILIPFSRNPETDKEIEFLEMTKITKEISMPTFEVFTTNVSDIEFIEGKRKRVEHFRVERSPLLRKYYLEQNPQPICLMCGTNMIKKYPWTEYMLDIHHLLPLSSSVAISTKGTSLEDIVGLCPTCHRSIHAYYRQWLKRHNQEDFESKEQAREVFKCATEEVVK